MKKSLVLWILCSSLLSCLDSSFEQVQQWISDKENGLVKEVENEYFRIEVSYKPQSYLVALENETRSNKEIPEEEYKRQLEEKENLQYFTIKLISKSGKPMLKTNLESEKEEDLRLHYYIGAFEQDIFLADGKDTLPCALYHFERAYGTLPFNNISVAFENKNQNKQDKTLLIADRALGFDVEQFTFNKEDIANVPVLKNN